MLNLLKILKLMGLQYNIIIIKLNYVWHKINDFYITLSFLFQAYVTLISSPHNISGRLCPGTAVFTCNAMTMSNLIQLFINDTQVADYILTSGDTYPHDVQSSLPEASVMLTSVTVKANNIITYENFTLSINIQDLNQYIGNNISCGTLLQRSSAIKIESYSIIGK